MKDLKTNWLKKQVYLLSILAVLFSSCDEEVIYSNYVGTWTALGSGTSGEVTTDFKSVLSFT